MLGYIAGISLLAKVVSARSVDVSSDAGSGATMPLADNRGVRIHYETVGKGRPVVLHHGTGGSGPDWVDFGYVEALRNNYQLILVDARGHGSSDKPHEPAAYDLSLRSSDVVSVLDDLDLPKADFFGYSLGGWIGFGLAKHAPARFNSFIFGGAHPFAENMQAFRDLMLTNREAFAAGIEKVFGNFLKPAMRDRLLNNDLEALRALTQDRSSIGDVLPSMQMPCLLYVGELDPRLVQVKECVQNATLFTLPGCDHVAAWAQVDATIPPVKSFLSNVPR
jgi:pimeloyl-ACP methyl ester carboxylesterase